LRVPAVCRFRGSVQVAAMATPTAALADENARLREIIAEQQEQMRLIITQQQQLLASAVGSLAPRPAPPRAPAEPAPPKLELAPKRLGAELAETHGDDKEQARCLEGSRVENAQPQLRHGTVLGAAPTAAAHGAHVAAQPPATRQAQDERQLSPQSASAVDRAPRVSRQPPQQQKRPLDGGARQRSPQKQPRLQAPKPMPPKVGDERTTARAGDAPPAGAVDTALLAAVLDLAIANGLCSAHQRGMVLDYVATGRFAAAYCLELWSSRLRGHSRAAEGALAQLLIAGPPPQRNQSSDVSGSASVSSVIAGAAVTPAAVSTRVAAASPAPRPPQTTRSSAAGAAAVKAEAVEDDDWADAPGQLLRRATRTFVEERRREHAETARPWVPPQAAEAPAEDLMELCPSATDAGTAAPASAGRAPLLLPRSLHSALRPYQTSGVLWLWNLFQAKQGGVLADEMGLGKTVQVCALLSGVRRAGRRRVLIVVPVSLLEQWASEASKWCPEWPVYTYYGTPLQRSCALNGVRGPQGGILLTSYSVLKNDDGELMQVRELADQDDIEMQGAAEWLGKWKRKLGVAAAPAASDSGSGDAKPWDMVVCDEAHVMRNISTLLGRRLREVRADCRVLLTGTPVQNALQDLWSLLDFAQPGLLGNHMTFVKRFSDPIDQGSVRGATPAAVALKKHLCEQLWRLVEPHMLRRTKESVGLTGDGPWTGGGDAPPACLGALLGCPAGAGDAVSKTLPPKVETVVWLQPTAEQVSVYRKLLAQSEVVRDANSKAKLGLEVFRAIGLLKRLCNHPVLGLPLLLPGAWEAFLREAGRASGKAAGKRRRQEPAPTAAADAVPAAEDDGDDPAASAGRAVEAMLRKLPRDRESLLTQSAKLRCLSKMLPALVARGHRTLVFSQGVKMLDLTELCVLKPQGIGYLRIDGQTDAQTRTARVRSFQSEPEKSQVMLLTTGVGGYGLNLTAADRVIILDPAWNPAVDMQAVDRAYRIGQQREVKTYRLVLSGLIEDKIFRLQVFKMGLTKTALEAKQQHRYFTANEIRGLFEWTEPAQGETRKLLSDKHGGASDEQAEEHARRDGAQEGWSAAGPVVCLSNFSSLYNALASDDGDAEGEEEACGEELKAMRDKLGRADEVVHKAGEARASMEQKLKGAEEELQRATQAVADAATERTQASAALKQRQAELTQAKREETSAEARLQKASRAEAQARDQRSVAEVTRSPADHAAVVAETELSQAQKALAAAESSLRTCFGNVEATLGLVDSDGAATSGGHVAASGPKRRAAQRCRDKAVKVVESAYGAWASWEAAFEVAVSADSAVSQAEAESYSRAATKEQGRAEVALVKARDRADAAREGAAQATAALQEAGVAFVETFVRAEGSAVLMSQVKATQQAAKASFRQLGTALQSWRLASETCAKVAALRRKAALKAIGGATAGRQAEAKVTAAANDRQEAEAAVAHTSAERSRLEKEVEVARKALADAEAKEAQEKRRKLDARSQLEEAKRAVRPAKAAEREAAQTRTALHRQFARSDAAGSGASGGVARVKAEVDALREGAQEALNAVQALRDEEYDANQVEEAYQAKKKQKVDAAACSE